MFHRSRWIRGDGDHDALRSRHLTCLHAGPKREGWFRQKNQEDIQSTELRGRSPVFNVDLQARKAKMYII